MPKTMTHVRTDGGAAKAEGPSDPAPASDTELVPRRERNRVDDVVPPAWLDRLLLAAVDLPLSEGEAAVANALVECVASLVFSHSVGVCLASSGPGARQVVVRRGPADRVDCPVETDPTRLFPGLRYECVIPLSGADSETTLHLGSDTDDLEAEGSPAVHLLGRAAWVLSRALPKARDAFLAATSAKRNARALERRMIQADKLATFGQLAAGVVHELNNPLTSIVAYSDYLVRKALDGPGDHDPEDIDRLRRVSESANRMLRFTRELVGYARPSSGAPGPVALPSVIDQAVAFCDHVLSAAGVTVERCFSPAAATAHGVGEQLVQVFVNLVTNACQAARAMGGIIRITTSPCSEGRRVLVVVEDDGCGIPPENREHVFVPFFTTKRDTHGTGLGLSIIKNIIESHDGTIRLESEVDRGTRFTIDLPAVAEA